MSLPVGYECIVCDKEEEDIEGGNLLRCSNCKNQFYCSVKCQKKDWNSHKANCSLCPSGEIPDPDIPITEERDLEVERVANIVQSIMEAFKRTETENPGVTRDQLTMLKGDIPEYKSFRESFTLSPGFEWSHGKKQWLVDPLTDILNAICRLYWINYIAHTDADQRRNLIAYFRVLTYPSHGPQLYADKTVKRPADLSAGEYRILMSIAGIIELGDESEEQKKKASKWFNLCEIWGQLVMEEHLGKKPQDLSSRRVEVF